MNGFMYWKYFVSDKVSAGNKIDGFLILLKGSFLKKKDKKSLLLRIALGSYVKEHSQITSGCRDG